MKQVSIITVNYRQAQITIDFLKSVKMNTDAAQVEVILVDNGQPLNDEDRYRTVNPKLVYIQSIDNLGFAGGNNLGINYASGEFLMFLNNDTELANNLIQVLVAELPINSSIGLISPLILYYDAPKVIQYAGYTNMNYLTCRNNGIGAMEVDDGQYADDSRETGYCHGAAMMCRRAELSA